MGSPEDVSSTGRAVRKMFAAVAPRYDFLNHFLSLGCDLYWRRATAKALGHALARPKSVAVDVCCGTGDLALALARVSSGKVIGADFCHPMLERALEKARRGPLRTRASGGPVGHAVFFLEADTLALPFRNDSVDVVSSAFGFRNLANYARGLEEMRRVLKPGGAVAILEFSRVRWPVFGPVFLVYFRHILPWLGTLISGVEGPYRYLADSVAKFPDQEALADSMRQAGFVKVCCRNFFGGVAALHLGDKSTGE